MENAIGEWVYVSDDESKADREEVEEGVKKSEKSLAQIWFISQRQRVCVCTLFFFANDMMQEFPVNIDRMREKFNMLPPAWPRYGCCSSVNNEVQIVERERESVAWVRNEKKCI